MTPPELAAIFAADPHSINNDTLLRLSTRYTPSQIAHHANAGRKFPVLSASNVRELMYRSITCIAKREGRDRDAVKAELEAARKGAGQVQGVDVKMVDDLHDSTAEKLRAAALLRAIEGSDFLTEAEAEALRRFGGSGSSEADSVEEDEAEASEDDEAENVDHEADSVDVDGLGSSKLSEPSSNTSASESMELDEPASVEDSEARGSTEADEADTASPSSPPETMDMDLSPTANPPPGPEADEAETSSTLSSPPSWMDLSDSESTISSDAAATLKDHLRALEVHGLFAAEETHLMDDDVVDLSTSYSVPKIVEQLNTGTGTGSGPGKSKYSVKSVQARVNAAVKGVATRRGLDVKEFSAEIEELRVAREKARAGGRRRSWRK
ncbi:hypothetical protein B0A55_10092 [Friedmanniomyces simplex]|uniref:Uncharacterized protein n=1 Tax=Friedmanniomyces simplex TaxID=329884 RepID=A0A4U0WUA5_9PEZI|nr:hypothetical protein B0A55_10092 [Friedmanniomyces simplex]